MVGLHFAVPFVFGTFVRQTSPKNIARVNVFEYVCFLSGGAAGGRSDGQDGPTVEGKSTDGRGGGQASAYYMIGSEPRRSTNIKKHGGVYALQTFVLQP